MMILKEVEVNGFKSFANKIVFKFDKGITAIVGPNGSGKSNVVDAIRWVLGEQKLKQLRGEKMEDVIFAGTEMRKSQGFAYVSLTIDNSTKEINCPYDEIKVSRKLYRSGESEYRINDNICRLKDINELFYDTGIGKEGYSIIGQGQIDQILSGKPQARRELIDEAIGIVKFKKRKNEAVKKLENDEINLTRLKDILAELTNQLIPLKKQSQKAREYVEVKTKLKKLEEIDFKFFYEETSGKLKEFEENLTNISNEINILNKEFGLSQEATEKIDEKLQEQRNIIEENNQNIQIVLTKMNELANSEKRLEQEIEYNKKLCNKIEETTNKNKVDYEEINVRQKELIENLDSTNNELSQNNIKLIEENIELTKVKKELNELKINLDKLQTSYNKILEDELDYIKEASYAKAKLEQIENSKLQIQTEIKQKEEELNFKKIRLEEIDSKITELQDELNKLHQKNTETEIEIKEFEVKIFNIQKEIQNNKEELIKFKSNQVALENMVQRFDGYSFAVKNLMSNVINENLLGTVSSIISTEKKYETAIEAALSGSLQHVVVSNADYAKEVVELLKRNKWGRCTLLPLDTIKQASKKAKLEGGVAVASDVVKYDKKYCNVISNLLDNTLVVNNIDDALKLNKKGYSSKIVTLSGEILQPFGSITGGSFKNNSSLLSRKREIEELKNKIDEITNKISKKNQEYQNLSNEKISKTEELKSNKEKLEKIFKEDIMLSQEKVHLSENMGVLEEEVKEMMLLFDKENSTSVDMPIKENIHNKDELKSQIDDINLKIEITMKKRSQVFEKINMLNTYLVRDEKEKEFLTAEISRNKLQKKKIEDDIIKGQKDVKAYQYENSKHIDTIETLKDEYKKLVLSHQEMVVNSKKLDKVLTEILDENKNIYLNRDTINEKILDSEKEKIRMQNKYEQLEYEFAKKTDYMFNEYEIVYSNIEIEDKNYDRVEISKNIRELKNKIRSFGAINVDAVYEYQQVNERYEFLSKQLNDIQNSKQELVKVIKSLDDGMKKQFEEKFDKLQTELQRVFKILFGGGNVSMQMLEPENILESGININAQPPGKKLQNMLQLSGGEKALSAISLMFAIQNLNPSPFCFLDEIEAALDDYNVVRFANYLNNLTTHTQFIVITHRKGTMTVADRLYGITMQEKGISTMVPVKIV